MIARGRAHAANRAPADQFVANVLPIVRAESDALCGVGTESSNVACHLPVARKGQNVEVFEGRILDLKEKIN